MKSQTPNGSREMKNESVTYSYLGHAGHLGGIVGKRIPKNQRYGKLRHFARRLDKTMARGRRYTGF